MAPLILIAEDDADIRSLLRLYLEGEGFRVAEAADGAAALDLARTEPPDMAILDVMMPGMNGFELTRALRAYSDVPILILSAKSQDNDKILGLNLGADDYIAKPFNPVEIVARVRAQLRRATPTMVSQGMLMRRMVSTRSDPSSTMPKPPLMAFPTPTPPPLCRAIRLMPRAALPA